jgi:outer membrane protein OmpA-like peptidoglycan-associated protein
MNRSFQYRLTGPWDVFEESHGFDDDDAEETFWKLKGDHEWEQATACPGPTNVIVSGFTRYSNAVASLPSVEQAKIRSIAGLIVRSHAPSCSPILTVRLVGHADRDLQREHRQPGFMMRVSQARATAMKRALELLINNRAISSRITWDVRGAGASRLIVPNPGTEPQRARNRRVEVFLDQRSCANECEREYRACLERASTRAAQTKCKMNRLWCLQRCKRPPV